MNPSSQAPDREAAVAEAAARPSTVAAVFSSTRIAEILAVPPKPALVPTPEQRAVIEHRLSGSTLVVAGAGSGKTETMANRVVWLVANGLIAPDQVLGLTFTRKAAGELRERISGRLMGFAERLTDADERGTLTPAEQQQAAYLRELLADGLEIPEVNTYNAFAAGVLQEYGIAAGIAPGSAVIDEATAWRIAREIILESRDADLATSELSIAQLVSHVLTLDHATSDNLTSLDRVDQVVAEFGRVLQLPYDEKARDGAPSTKVYAPVRDAVASLAETPLITRLARAYAEEKQRRGVIEFSDQLALATAAIDQSADAIQTLRLRHRAVLLDEVQDTSVGQTRFLSKIFAGMPVMAVGDPHQSIYGWRGASAEGLQSFHADFRGRSRSTRANATERVDRTVQADAATLTLSTSWRNPESVLRAANAIASPLVAESVIEVPSLSSRPGAALGTIEWAYPETIHEERTAVAEWLRAARAEHLAEHGELPSAAVIFRKRSPMAAFAAALSEAGVPNRIVGLGGLLSTPEITDIVSTLRCLWYADAGSDLIRLLAGPRFRLGVSDIAGLREAARWFAKRDFAQRPLDAADLVADSVLPDPDRQYTLIDALDQIAGLRDLDHAALRDVSEIGRERLREAGRMLTALRHGVGGRISELIGATVQALRLDIELDANEATGHAGTSAAHANIDTFTELVENYLTVDTRGTLPSLLEWIERAAQADETAEHVAAPQPGTVQLITAHGSKGLEWDLVVVPRLVAGEFPGAARTGSGWLRTGQLPDELRGDAAARPQLNWRIADTQKELRDRIAAYKQELKDRQEQEERRLAYVAVTRSAGRLLLSGSFWGGQTRPRVPSPYLAELEAAGLIVGLPSESAHEDDPSELSELTLQWPLDPLGARRPAVMAAAETLRAALDRTEARAAALARASGDPAGEVPGDPATHLDETVRLLLAERRANELLKGKRGAEAPAEEQRDRPAPPGGSPGSASAQGEGTSHQTNAVTGQSVEVDLPERITASTFHEFIEDPERAERHRLRPIPQRPYRRTRIGNRFHEWVERRATTARGTAVTLDGFEQLDRDPATDASGVSSPATTPALPLSLLALDPESVDADRSEFEREFEREPELEPLIEQFERSRWADLQPIAVEQEVSLPFAGRTLVCKLDAVYASARDGEVRYEVVDWKAGRSPKTAAERESRFFQLDLYRHAYAQWAAIDPARIDVSLFYVAEGVELAGRDPRTLAELEAIWWEAAAKLNG